MTAEPTVTTVTIAAVDAARTLRTTRFDKSVSSGTATCEAGIGLYRAVGKVGHFILT